MTIAHLLEDFSAYDSARRNGGSANEEIFDLVRLEGFDAGYKAGWDDATKALKDNTDSISATLRENLSDLTFTYHEARNGILKSLAPVIEEIIQSVLPMILHNSFPAFVSETIQELASDSSNPTVNLRVHPDHADVLSKELDQSLDMPFRVKGDRFLSKDTALLEIGHTEMEIDFTAFLEKISGTVSTFFDPEKGSIRYG
tara:strand:+ start:62 stop:661 length:600 start_codon:yes stop_codon:yes gene_type:complete